METPTGTPAAFVVRAPGGGAGLGTGGWVAGRGWASVGEKVVARALACLEGLCRSKQCERFMTPLAREVGGCVSLVADSDVVVCMRTVTACGADISRSDIDQPESNRL